MNRSLGSEFADANDSPGLMLWRVSNRWQACQRAALRPFNLTHVQFVLLAWLQGDSPVTQRALSDHAHTDPMMTSQVLRVLDTKGLVRREPNPTDGRARALTLTPERAAPADRANRRSRRRIGNSLARWNAGCLCSGRCCSP